MSADKFTSADLTRLEALGLSELADVARPVAFDGLFHFDPTCQPSLRALGRTFRSVLGQPCCECLMLGRSAPALAPDLALLRLALALSGIFGSAIDVLARPLPGCSSSRDLEAAMAAAGILRDALNLNPNAGVHRGAVAAFLERVNDRLCLFDQLFHNAKEAVHRRERADVAVREAVRIHGRTSWASLSAWSDLLESGLDPVESDVFTSTASRAYRAAHPDTSVQVLALGPSGATGYARLIELAYRHGGQGLEVYLLPRFAADRLKAMKVLGSSIEVAHLAPDVLDTLARLVQPTGTYSDLGVALAAAQRL